MNGAFEKARRRRYRDVEIEVDGEVLKFRLRSLTAREWLEATSASYVDEIVQPDMMARFVAYAIVDENGESPLANEAGVAAVSEWDAAITRKLFEVVQELCGMSSEKKASSPGQAATSSTG